MKNIIKKTVALTLVLVLSFSFSISTFATHISNQALEPSVLYDYSDPQEQLKKSIVKIGDVTLYAFQNEELTYVAQISDQGDIHFSYIMNSDGLLKSSSSYNVKSINSSNISQRMGEGYLDTLENINYSIIQNLQKIEPSNILQPSQKANIDDDELYELLEEMWGSEYGPITIDSTTKYYNNINYSVFCNEVRAIYTEDYYIDHFIAGTALDTIAAWVTSKGALRPTLIAAILSVASFAVTNGAYYLEHGTTLKRAMGVLNTSRFVTVDDDDQAWTTSSWRRRVIMLGGQYGWTPDTEDFDNIKHALFDNTTTLMNYGFDAYINAVLL